MNYSQLKQAIQDYTEYEESSFVTNIPTFVRQAEEKNTPLSRDTRAKKERGWCRCSRQSILGASF